MADDDVVGAVAEGDRDPPDPRRQLHDARATPVGGRRSVSMTASATSRYSGSRSGSIRRIAASGSPSSNGRCSPCVARSASTDGSARSHTTWAPERRNAVRFSGLISTPPAAAITSGSLSSSASTSAAVSRTRNAGSPSVSKICCTVRPVRASMSSSESTIRRPRRAATSRPTVVLPAPIIPTRTMWRSRAASAVTGAWRGTRRRCGASRRPSRRRTCAAPRRRARAPPSSRRPRPSPARRSRPCAP